MSELETSTAEILVHLVRPSGAKQEYHLTAGATVGDLVRVSEIWKILGARTVRSRLASFAVGQTVEDIEDHSKAKLRT
jgi:hypothetical protein